MRYVFKIVRIIFWGLAIAFIVPAIWILVNISMVLWHLNFIHCFSLFDEGWLKDLTIENEPELYIDENGSHWKHGFYKNITDYWNDRISYKD